MSETLRNSLDVSRFKSQSQLQAGSGASGTPNSPKDSFEQVLNGFYVKKCAFAEKGEESGGGKPLKLDVLSMISKSNMTNVDMSGNLMSKALPGTSGKAERYRADTYTEKTDRQQINRLKKIKARLSDIGNKIDSSIERTNSADSRSRQLNKGDLNKLKEVVKRLESVAEKLAGGDKSMNRVADADAVKPQESSVGNVDKISREAENRDVKEVEKVEDIDFTKLFGMVEDIEKMLKFGINSADVSKGNVADEISNELSEIKTQLGVLKNREQISVEGGKMNIDDDMEVAGSEVKSDIGAVRPAGENTAGSRIRDIQTPQSQAAATTMQNQTALQDQVKQVAANQTDIQAQSQVQGITSRQNGASSQGTGTNAQGGMKQDGDISIKSVTSGKGAETSNVEEFAGKLDILKSDNTLTKLGKSEMNPNMRRLEASVLEQLENMMKSNLKIVKSGSTEIIMKLRPDNLGNVSIKMAMDSGALSATLSVENPMVKAIVESNLSDLKSALAEKGYDVSGFNVNLSNGGMKENREQAQGGMSGGTFESKASKGDEKAESLNSELKSLNSESEVIDSLV